LGAFGGFVIPPIMGAIVRNQGESGYASGFVVFVVLALFSLGMAYSLKRTNATQAKTAVDASTIR